MKWLVAVVALILIVVFGGISIYMGTQEEVKVTITEKERVNYGTTSKYLLWSEDEVFENTDNFIFFKFHSSDIYGNLKVGQTYTIKVVGWRFPLLSMYRNILDVKESAS